MRVSTIQKIRRTFSLSKSKTYRFPVLLLWSGCSPYLDKQSFLAAYRTGSWDLRMQEQGLWILQIIYYLICLSSSPASSPLSAHALALEGTPIEPTRGRNKIYDKLTGQELFKQIPRPPQPLSGSADYLVYMPSNGCFIG